MAIIAFTIAVPITAVAFSLFQFRRKVFGREIQSRPLKQLHRFLFSGWAFDWFYQKVFIDPFTEITRINKHDIIDHIPTAIINISRNLNKLFGVFQNGQLRWYSGSLVLFTIAALTYALTM